MEATIEKKSVLKGGEFLVKESEAHDIFTREELTEEQKMFGDATKQFIDTRILPNAEDIEEQKEGLTPSLLEELGELGVLGAGLPMEYNGQGLDFITDTVLSEEIGKSGSFGVSVAAHTGIGTLPIYYYGTEDQKAKYLPGLATGKLKAAYCLTEPSSGSDALGAKSTAVLDGDEWVLNGQKMWITNGGFADIFIVFAQVDGDKFTGFIVPGDTAGITRNAEEKKLGIKGSSTRQIFFENVRIPKDYVLGEIGKGHKIAFNVLNIGRYKLCAMVNGGAKRAIGVSANYTNERKQFGKNLHEFGAIKHKLAEMAIRTFVTDSATYRTAGYIDDLINQLLEEGKTPAEAKLIAAEEYSIECALLKVLGSETLDFVVDENVQIHGGMGYSEEGHAARAYRDARINRIFEGTNEINRLLSIGMMMKKGMKGEIDLLGPAMAVGKELMSVPSFGSAPEGFFGKEKQAVFNAKKAGLLVAGAAAQKFMQKLEEQQEIMMYLADMLMDVFAAESTLLRVEKMVAAKGEEACSLQIDMARTFLADAMNRINDNGRSAVAGFAEGDEMRMMLMGLKRFTKLDPVNTIAARRRIADHIVEQNAYTF